MAENNTYPYEPDQFDREADMVGAHGAHRVEDPLWKQNLTPLVVIALAIVGLVAALWFISTLGSDNSAEPPADNATQSAPVATQAAQPSASPSASEAPAAEADKDAKVMLLNGSGKNGLASEWKKALKKQDWTGIDTGTSKEKSDKPGVFYKNDEDAGTAAALAKYLDVEATKSSDYDWNITMVVTDSPDNLGDKEQGGDGQGGADQGGDGQGNDGQGDNQDGQGGGN